MPRKLPNWIKAYLVYTHESESPEVYHKWCAIGAIAGALRRKVFFDMGYFLVRTNMYTVLVGPAGRCKKSTAMRISRGMLKGVPGLNFTTDSTSRERLIIDMAQTFHDAHSSMTAYSSEFASLFATSGVDMIVFLTDIYDSPDEWEHRTKTGGTNKIKAPYLNMIGGTTPDWISKAMPLDTLGIGLTSRITFVYEDTPRIRPARPQLSEEQKMLLPLLVEDLTKISTIHGEYKFDSEATDKEYDQWYQSQIVNPNVSGDPRLNGYYARKPIHLLKLAMILSAAQRDETVITSEDLKLAHSLLEEIEDRMPKVFAAVGKNPLSADYFDILTAIESADGGIKFGDLLNQFRHSVRKDELAEIIETLAASNHIVALEGQRYKSANRLSD